MTSDLLSNALPQWSIQAHGAFQNATCDPTTFTPNPLYGLLHVLYHSSCEITTSGTILQQYTLAPYSYLVTMLLSPPFPIISHICVGVSACSVRLSTCGSLLFVANHLCGPPLLDNDIDLNQHARRKLAQAGILLHTYVLHIQRACASTWTGTSPSPPHITCMGTVSLGDDVHLLYAGPHIDGTCMVMFQCAHIQVRDIVRCRVSVPCVSRDDMSETLDMLLPKFPSTLLSLIMEYAHGVTSSDMHIMTRDNGILDTFNSQAWVTQDGIFLYQCVSVTGNEFNRVWKYKLPCMPPPTGQANLPKPSHHHRDLQMDSVAHSKPFGHGRARLLLCEDNTRLLWKWHNSYGSWSCLLDDVCNVIGCIRADIYAVSPNGAWCVDTDRTIYRFPLDDDELESMFIPLAADLLLPRNTIASARDAYAHLQSQAESQHYEVIRPNKTYNGHTFFVSVPFEHGSSQLMLISCDPRNKNRMMRYRILHQEEPLPQSSFRICNQTANFVQPQLAQHGEMLAKQATCISNLEHQFQQLTQTCHHHRQHYAHTLSTIITMMQQQQQQLHHMCQTTAQSIEQLQQHVDGMSHEKSS